MIKESKQEARKLWENIAKELFSANPQELKKIGKIDISYNVSQGFFDDLFESAEQVMSNEWGWEKFSIFFRTYLETHNIQESYDVHIPNLTTQVNAYKESIKLGHGVIVVAHSQGNYYTNEAYEQLDPWMKDYFHMFGVATPANHVAGFSVDDAAAPYVKFHNDFINFIVTSLPSNLDDTRHHGFPSTNAHDFNESYMKEETSKKIINDFIIDEIQKHSKNDSQWELDQEKNVGTRDYKITLKHRFDTSIIAMQDIEVYPFAPAKKLYHVIDNTGGNGWVKASCGGDEVVNYWDGKKDTEAYLIDNTQHEMILYPCNEGFHHDSDTSVCIINSPVVNVTISIVVETHGAHEDGNGWEVVTCNGNIPAYNGAWGVSASATDGRCLTWGLYPYVKNDNSYIGVVETAYAVIQEYLTNDINITKDWYSYDKVLSTVDGSAYDGYIYQKAFYTNIIPKVQ
jgi:hypothetical protein